VAESHQTWALGDHIRVHGWSKGGSDDDDEDLGTGIESNDKYDLYMARGNKKRKG
jgi:hypothetical protein